MKRVWKQIFLIGAVLLFLPCISSRSLQFTQTPSQPKIMSNAVEPDTIEEIVKPANWVARGGCWDFSKKIIRAQGLAERPIAYLKSANFTDFKCKIKLRIVGDDDGSYGLVFRFDEQKDMGYVFGVFPHGSYEFFRLEEGSGIQTNGGPAVYLKDQLKTWNTLTVVCKGSKFDLYINDNLLVTIKDENFKSGHVGLYVGGSPTSVLEYEVQSLVVK